MSKYRAKKTEIDGILFDSKKEANRYVHLSNDDSVSNLRMQVSYELIPKQCEEDTVESMGGVKKGKVIERACTYIADFVYDQNGETVVEDVKGFRTADYKIKRKLMLYVHGIRIKEV